MKAQSQSRSDAWGRVYRAVMQDETLSIELRALIAIAATSPSDFVAKSGEQAKWRFRFSWLKQKTGWGREKLRVILSEARERGFFQLVRSSDGHSIESFYSFVPLRRPENRADGHRPEKPSHGISGGIYKSTKNLKKGKNKQVSNEKHETQETQVRSAVASRAPSEVLSRENYEAVIKLADGYGIDHRDKAVRRLLRKIWEETSGSNADRIEQMTARLEYGLSVESGKRVLWAALNMAGAYVMNHYDDGDDDSEGEDHCDGCGAVLKTPDERNRGRCVDCIEEDTQLEAAERASHYSAVALSSDDELSTESHDPLLGMWTATPHKPEQHIVESLPQPRKPALPAQVEASEDEWAAMITKCNASVNAALARHNA